jgi:hypothetical protein
MKHVIDWAEIQRAGIEGGGRVFSGNDNTQADINEDSWSDELAEYLESINES